MQFCLRLKDFFDFGRISFSLALLNCPFQCVVNSVLNQDITTICICTYFAIKFYVCIQSHLKRNEENDISVEKKNKLHMSNLHGENFSLCFAFAYKMSLNWFLHIWNKPKKKKPESKRTSVQWRGDVRGGWYFSVFFFGWILHRAKGAGLYW